MDGLKEIKVITGKEGEEWSSFMRGVLEEYGDRKRLRELIAAEGWQTGRPPDPAGQ